MEPAEWPWPVRSGNWGRFCCQLPSPATWMKFGHLGLPNTCNTKEPQQGLCYVGYVVAQCVVMFLFVTLTNWCNDFKHLLKTKAYVWDVSLPFVFCLCRLAAFHCWCSLLASDIIPLTTCWYFRLYSWIPSQFCWWRIGRSLVAAPRYGSASNLLLAPSFLQEWELVKSALWESQCCQNKLNCYPLGTGRCLNRYYIYIIYTFRITLGT